MKFDLKDTVASHTQANCLIVGMFEDSTFSCAAKAIDTASDGFLKNLLKKDAFSGKLGETLLLHHIPGITAERVLLVGCGKDEFTLEKLKKVAQSAASLVTQFKHIACFLTNLKIKQHDIYWKIRICLQAFHDAAYEYTACKSDTQSNALIDKLTFSLISKDDPELAKKGVKEAHVIANAISFSKDLGNTPSNLLTPADLAECANQLAKAHKKVSCTLLDEKKLKSKKMGGLLAVGQGSINPPRMIILEYKGGKKSDPYTALVGKGITFDAGGVNLKPFQGMWLMKMDMCGSATVLAVFKAIVELKLPLNIGLVVASAENMCSGSAYKPGDVITTYSGKTIEVRNTDAEGRIVLSDAITYAQEKFNPKVLFDVATLTGACIVALGNEYSGLMGNHQQTIDEMKYAGEKALDHAWQLPINENIRQLLDSKIADMCNIASKPIAGTITAGAFLEKFVDRDVNWVHIDIAGTAMADVATGRPVAMMIQYMLNHA